MMGEQRDTTHFLRIFGAACYFPVCGTLKELDDRLRFVTTRRASLFRDRLGNLGESKSWRSYVVGLKLVRMKPRVLRGTNVRSGLVAALSCDSVSSFSHPCLPNLVKLVMRSRRRAGHDGKEEVSSFKT